MITFKAIDENSLDFQNDELYCTECGCKNVWSLQEKHDSEDNSYEIVCFAHSDEIVF